MITPPTYGMYKVTANVNDVTIQSVPLTEDFQLRVPEVREVDSWEQASACMLWWTFADYRCQSRGTPE
jgi:histidinol-phosphate/aromatic aminotransferase/cobyric acid decarboxylase-like protein